MALHSVWIRDQGIREHNRKDDLARKHLEGSEYGQASILFKENFAWAKTTLGPKDPVTLDDQDILAFTLHELGKYDDAATLNEQTLHMRRRKYGEEHPETLEIQHNLAYNLYRLGRYKEAAELDRRTLKTREVTLGKDNEDTLSSRHNLAATLEELNLYDEAEKLNRENLGQRKKQPLTDVDLIATKHNLATNLFHLDRLREAKSLVLGNINVLRAQGKDDPQFATSEELCRKITKALDKQNELEWEKRKTKRNLEQKDTKNAESHVTTTTHGKPIDHQKDKRAKDDTAGHEALPNRSTHFRVRVDSAKKAASRQNRSKSDNESRTTPKEEQGHKQAKRGSTIIDRSSSSPETTNQGSKSNHDRNQRKISYDKGRLPVPNDIAIRASSAGPHPREPAETNDDQSPESVPSKLKASKSVSNLPKTGPIKTGERAKKPKEPVEVRDLLKELNIYSNLCDAHRGVEDLPSAKVADAWFQRLEAYTQGLLAPHRKELMRRVKIAILDTGIDLSHPDLKQQWEKRGKEVKSWTVEDGDKDTCGHGSHAAALLMRVAPEAQIYVARVVKDYKDTLEPENVSQAIMHAADKWKVDIITMSFGFPRRYLSMEKAIDYASSKNIIMFAAAANHGANDKIAFPASAMLKVICINSADGNGARSKYNPPAVALSHNFSALGEAVLSAWPKDLKKGPEKRQWGTSTATPIAAAIAALILEFSKIPLIKITHRARLKTMEGMREVLAAMGEEKDGYKNIVPWKLLDQRMGKDSVTRIASRISDVLDSAFGLEDDPG